MYSDCKLKQYNLRPMWKMASEKSVSVHVILYITLSVYIG